MSYQDNKPKDVFVIPYSRIRHNKLESVCQHWRSRPYQFSLLN
jgi:hypothetical protein